MQMVVSHNRSLKLEMEASVNLSLRMKFQLHESFLMPLEKQHIAGNKIKNNTDFFNYSSGEEKEQKYEVTVHDLGFLWMKLKEILERKNKCSKRVRSI